MKSSPLDMELETLVHRAEQLARTVATLEQRIRLLDEENVRFARLLQEQGIEVRASSQIAVELPPPNTEPLTLDNPGLPVIRENERRLLEEACGGKPFYFLLRSLTRIDTGLWFQRSFVWVAAQSDRLAMFATGKKAWVDLPPFQHLQQSLYNHVTGEVVLAPATGLRVDRFRASPLDGAQILAQIYAKKEDANA